MKKSRKSPAVAAVATNVIPLRPRHLVTRSPRSCLIGPEVLSAATRLYVDGKVTIGPLFKALSAVGLTIAPDEQCRAWLVREDEVPKIRKRSKE